MYDKKLIWLGSLVTAAIITSNSAVAQTNQSDTSGGQTFSSPTQQIDSKNGNGIPPTTQFDPATGEVIGGGLDNPVQLNNPTGDNSDQTGEVASELNLGCAENSCAESGAQPRQVTLNEVAEALDAGLKQSLDNLAAAENNAQLADAGPRRIARRSAVSNQDARACVNPVFEARDLVERQLAESEKFIEQVNQIEPQKNIW
ncbi:MAG: hypothetical protein AAFY63_23170 [Cyanobacteria bacterium J06643_13]